MAARRRGRAIVDAPTFAAAAARLAARGRENVRRHRSRPRHLLSGLLKCGACGAGMSVMAQDKTGRTRIRRTATSENGTCPDPKRFYLDPIEAAVLEGLREELLEPEALDAYVEGYMEERERLYRAGRGERDALERRLAANEREHERVIDRLAKGIGDEYKLGARSKELAAEEAKLRQALAAPPPAPEAPPVINKWVVADYRRRLDRLRETVADGIADGGEAAAAIRALVDRVVVRRAGEPPRGRKPGGIEVEVSGKLNALLGKRPSQTASAVCRGV